MRAGHRRNPRPTAASRRPTRLDGHGNAPKFENSFQLSEYSSRSCPKLNTEDTVFPLVKEGNREIARWREFNLFWRTLRLAHPINRRRGLCSVCGTMMHRRMAMAQLELIQGKLEVTSVKGVRP